MSRYVKIFKVNEDKNNKLMSLPIDDEKLLDEYKIICNRKTKIITYGDKVYTNFCGLNVPEDGVKCESFTVISIDSLLVYESKYYLQVYLDNYACKIVDKRMIDYLGGNPFET